MKYKDFKGGCYIRISVKCRHDTLALFSRSIKTKRIAMMAIMAPA
jgi:hypothetical protein